MDDEARPAARLTVLSGPSGVGKDSGIELIRARSPWIQLSVVGTRRLEWSESAGNLYGTPRAQVEGWIAQGAPVLLKIDLQGARQVRAAMSDAQLVFLAPPSVEELKRRLVGRGTDDEEPIKRRLAHADEQLAAESEFDVTVVNDFVERAADELVGL